MEVIVERAVEPDMWVKRVRYVGGGETDVRICEFLRDYLYLVYIQGKYNLL